ncbi:glycoside hydrolase family 9 protein [Amycolatopsis sp. NPDC051371]|uniref:glycoside hydrolase family 9 protein n=1 Tax=Amycolatopsis sp. NPDC051371 TaxID=3155800 RepID=UPI0034288B64
MTGTGTYAAFATRQRNWVLGANAWGSSFVIGTGSVSPHCPEHQSADLTGEFPAGAAVNGPNQAEKFAELNRFPTMRACAVPDFSRFDGHGARYLDDVGVWQSVEPADDFTATALLYFALAGGRRIARWPGRRRHFRQSSVHDLPPRHGPQGCRFHRRAWLSGPRAGTGVLTDGWGA